MSSAQISGWALKPEYMGKALSSPGKAKKTE